MHSTLDGAGARISESATSRQARIRLLSERLVAAQRPLRILSAVRWAPEVEDAFFAAGCRELPNVDRATYERAPLLFNPECKRQELIELERDIKDHLGQANACSQMMVRRCREYRQVAELLVARGTPAFARLSGELFGSSAWQQGNRSIGLDRVAGLIKQALRKAEGARDVSNVGLNGAEPFGDSCGIDASARVTARGLDSPRSPKSYGAFEAAQLLERRLRDYFGDRARCRLELAHQILAEAQASGSTVKLRADAQFTLNDIRLLEVHEGWVHIATTFNGRAQKNATFLAKSSPSATVTQEGLAVLTEILAGTTHAARLRRLANRIEAVAMAEAGANFLEVYRFFLAEEGESRASYHHTERIFRGSLPAGCGPFTKDLSYLRGLLALLHFLSQAARNGCARWLSVLFCGKMALAELPMAVQLAEEGILSQPTFVPPFFAAGSMVDLWAELAGSLASAFGLRSL
jgi:uncharacterized protein (TIGR02421 family)